jgi:lysophospholipase L1-like esterase
MPILMEHSVESAAPPYIEAGELVRDYERSRRPGSPALADAEDAGLYDLPGEVSFERLPAEGTGE